MRFGDSVQKGQPLLDIDSPDLVAAQTDYLRAGSALAQSQRTLSRQQDLKQAGIGAAREVEQAQTDRDLAHSEQSGPRCASSCSALTPEHSADRWWCAHRFPAASSSTRSRLASTAMISPIR